MAGPIWKGSLSFGLVHIPVQIEPAVRSAERVSFRQLHKSDHAPIRYKRVCETEGVEVPWGEIVKGFEYEKGKFVVLTPEEIKAVALPSTRVIEILEFVERDAVDERYFETPYYLLPQKGGEKPYALLREAVRESGMLGVGKVTLREGSHHLAAVRVIGDAIVLELMRFQDELVEPDAYTFPSAEGVRPQELKMAAELIRNLAEPFEPEKYRDEYRDALRALIQKKLEGEEITIAEPQEPEGTPVVDLLARLKESVAMREKSRGGASSSSASASAKPRKTAKKRKSA